MRLERYIALIHKTSDSDFGVSFPDFPGIATAGKTIAEASDMAHEALELHIEGMLADDEDIPLASSFEEAKQKDDTGAILFMLVPIMIKAQSIRVNVSLPEEVLKQIDEYAAANGMTRSGFLVQAARSMIRAEP